jgi:hypothetical protein
MSIESLTYADLAGRLGTSPEAARALARRLRLPRTKGNDGKARITVDLADIQYKPAPTRPPGGSRPDIDALNARIEHLQTELARLEMEKSRIEATAARHREDFERERERCDAIIAEALRATEVAMSARESAARLQGELAARQRQPWWKRVVAKPPTPWRALPSQLGEAMGAVLRSLTRGRLGLLQGHRKLFIAYEAKPDLALNSGEASPIL